MSDPTPAEARAIADDIMGRRRGSTDEDIIEAAAAHAPAADDEISLPPADCEADTAGGAE